MNHIVFIVLFLVCVPLVLLLIFMPVIKHNKIIKAALVNRLTVMLYNGLYISSAV